MKINQGTKKKIVKKSKQFSFMVTANFHEAASLYIHTWKGYLYLYKYTYICIYMCA